MPKIQVLTDGIQIQPTDFRLGRDPEVRYTGNGKPVCNLRLVSTYTYSTKKDGKPSIHEEVDWINGVIWGQTAEKIGAFLKNGDLITVRGRIDYREWETKDTKQHRSSHDLIISRLVFRARPSSAVAIESNVEIGDYITPEEHS